MIARRYRIAGLLGRGGMGEVYRADDVKLGQTVALKFLPAEMETDPGWLERFLIEVRTARQVTHPNVCRVYDVGEIDGRHFLSMEYVDGEDLASLLRRIGRLPPEKATQIARQLCAGLAASHDEGILHRDLKPANVMIDGKGRVRITDFGLARWAGTVHGADAMAGTPAYMAPEQIAGREVTVRTDLYALGLVLYELYTGKPVFRARTPAELRRLQEESTPASMSSLVEHLDPAVESIVSRCLDRDPGERPSSALAVAAALPGGDPLAAALAAGETPSPEMVAAAGDTGSTSPRVGLTYLAIALAGLGMMVGLRAPMAPHRVMPLELSPPVLENRARQLLQDLGHTTRPIDSCYGFEWNNGYLERIASAGAEERTRLGAHESPAALLFWYRDSPADLVAWSSSLLGFYGDRVTPDDPPMTEPGMRSVTLGPRGRLVSFAVLASPGAAGPEEESSAWERIFAAAGLDPAAFTATEPAHVPPVPSDRRLAWSGHYPDEPDWPLRIEAASLAGVPVWFEQFAPWDPATHQELLDRRAEQRRTSRFLASLVATLFLGGFAVLFWLALRNLRAGRGDRRGATRVVLFLIGANLAFWLFHASHVGHWGTDGFRLLAATTWALARAIFATVIFLALEPYIRRYWPDRMISWTRLLSGRWRDPLVGRDLLAGSTVAIVATLSVVTVFWATRWPLTINPHPALADALLSPRYAVAHMAGGVNGALGNSLFLLAFLVLCRVLLRVKWLATGVWVIVASLLFWALIGLQFATLPIGVVLAGAMAVVIHRYGLLAYFSTAFWFFVVAGVPVTTDFDAWYSTSTMVTLVALLAFVIGSFAIATHGQFREGARP